MNMIGEALKDEKQAAEDALDHICDSDSQTTFLKDWNADKQEKASNKEMVESAIDTEEGFVPEEPSKLRLMEDQHREAYYHFMRIGEDPAKAYELAMESATKSLIEPLIKFPDNEFAERYYNLLPDSSFDTCFVCGCEFDCHDNPRIAVSINLECYMCHNCIEKEPRLCETLKQHLW